MIEVNSLWAMPTYTAWKKEAQRVLPDPCGDKFLRTDAATVECLDLYTEIWAKVCMQHYCENWEETLPIMHVLCMLGYFLVQADLLSRGNALASVEYVLDLLDSTEITPDLQAWRVKFEEIQQAL
ncbi:MAG: hypothetical protein LBH52_04210 [Puniceicoccales bacterium]|jgi:hypothetical protein|nr:hypothetical protein [Puniceicoccales bacterium]